MHNSSEDKVLRLLLYWQIIESNDARVRLRLNVLLFAIHPACFNLLTHPALVDSTGNHKRIISVSLHPILRAGLLQHTSKLPRLMTMVPKALAIRPIHLMANPGYF